MRNPQRVTAGKVLLLSESAMISAPVSWIYSRRF